MLEKNTSEKTKLKKTSASGKKKKAEKKTGTSAKAKPQRRRKKKKPNYPAVISALFIVLLLVFFVFPKLKTDDKTVNGKSGQVYSNKDDKSKENPLNGNIFSSEKPPAPAEKFIKPEKEEDLTPPELQEAELENQPPFENGEDAYAVPEVPVLPEPDKGSLIFVFDDAGHNLEQLQYFLDLPFKCTIAVLPMLKHSKECANRIRTAGKEVILHQPMQAINENIDPGPGAVKPEMSAEEIKSIVIKNIEELWPIAGMNNHEGSLITANGYAMRAVLSAAKEKGIYFLDSKTNINSAAVQTGKEENMHVWERSVFIDNNNDKAYIKEKIIEGIKTAERNGYAIMIGHVFTIELAEILKELYPELIEAGYTFSVISEIAGKNKQ